MMARRYISKHILEDQQQFLKLIDEFEMDIFNLKDIESFIEYEFSNLNEIMENLVEKKFLSRIERGKYCRTNFRDEKVIGCHLVADGVLAYWSALNFHGFTEQFPNIVFIQTTKVKGDMIVFGVPYQFVKIIPKKRGGIQKEGVGNHIFTITNVEKTFVDCFDLPQYSGGYPELIRAFNVAVLNPQKLIEACLTVSNLSVIKRIAFLSEFLEKKGLSKFLKFAEDQVNPRYILMDPFGKEEGIFNNKWKLRLNISENEICSICNKQY
jgi:predicted transcriptional regulator of viral defense system